MKNRIEKAKEHIQNADAILITAGAGMGVDSGLPDFRGNIYFINRFDLYLCIYYQNIA